MMGRQVILYSFVEEELTLNHIAERKPDIMSAV